MNENVFKLNELVDGLDKKMNINRSKENIIMKDLDLIDENNWSEYNEKELMEAFFSIKNRNEFLEREIKFLNNFKIIPLNHRNLPEFGISEIEMR
jgi:hypothetical protein